MIRRFHNFEDTSFVDLIQLAIHRLLPFRPESVASGLGVVF